MCRKCSYETHVKNDSNYITVCASATNTIAALIQIWNIIRGIALALGGSVDEFEGKLAGDPFWVFHIIGYLGASTISAHIDSVSRKLTMLYKVGRFVKNILFKKIQCHKHAIVTILNLYWYLSQISFYSWLCHYLFAMLIIQVEPGAWI